MQGALYITGVGPVRLGVRGWPDLRGLLSQGSRSTCRSVETGVSRCFLSEVDDRAYLKVIAD